MKGLRLALCVMPFLSGGAAIAESVASFSVQLRVGQTIRSADALLLASGWSPLPDQPPNAFERKLSGVALPALSACSGTGKGFCRYNYARESKRLSVVTIPSPSAGEPGLVQRWWIE